ncbi:hypothetical protein GCK72_021570 [Caenorhabditis remanei]|uniref:Uncharacterized protein n=1 Tax=Caenorhabditis remanei TaxID=31234 RepID=A0A6A5GK05_CAERE|nr:hypothetical protein GCK72_021570 [Caenorhabditis remanei]KAF1755003.1 hypothetical protein GCK72_021570 [Caenorhabditis remanei]
MTPHLSESPRHEGCFCLTVTSLKSKICGGSSFSSSEFSDEFGDVVVVAASEFSESADSAEIPESSSGIDFAIFSGLPAGFAPKIARSPPRIKPTGTIIIIHGIEARNVMERNVLARW